MSKTSVSDNADHFVFIPDYITVRDKTYCVKDLLMTSSVLKENYRYTGNEWKCLVRSSAKKQRLALPQVCDPCSEDEYVEKPSTSKRYKKWYDLITLSFKEFMIDNPSFKATQFAPQKCLAKQRALNDANFSCWLHKNGLA
jgi:hypothetical protein